MTSKPLSLATAPIPGQPPRTHSQWSLAGKLVTLYGITASTSLLIACGFLYWTLVSNIDYEHKKLLSSALAELQTVLQQQPLNLNLLKQQVRQESEYTKAPHSASFHPSSAHYSYFRVFNAQQQPVVETNNMISLFPVTIFPEFNVDFSLAPDAIVQTENGRKFLLIAQYLPDTNDIGAQWGVQVALNISQDEALVLQYQKMLTLVLVAGVCFSTLAGFWITKQGLKPLKKITRSVKTITINRLHPYISTDSWPAELTLLAAAFDEMLDRLDESFARLTQFTADLAHELRTPINNLMGETEIALSRKRSTQEYHRILESNMEEFNRINRMIEELLFLSRAESPETKINREVLVLENEMEKICAFYESLASDQKIKLRIEGHANVFADPMLMRRALNNLIANAISYTDREGEINLTIKPGDNCTEIHVCDNGIGIDAGELPKIFDRFYRADKARVKNIRGTGLGLSLVKSIMDLHRGTVTVESQIGKGTTAILRLPFKRPHR